MNQLLVDDAGGFQQIGMVVADADKTMAYMTDRLGVQPFKVLREITLDNFWYRGGFSRSPVLTVGLTQAGPVQIEIIQQHDDAPSVYREFLQAGQEGCQHLSVWFSERSKYDSVKDRLVDKGLNLVQQGGSIERLRYCFFESEIPGQPMIELSEALLFDVFANQEISNTA